MNSEQEKEYEQALAEEPDTEKERDDEYDATLEKILALLPDKKFVQAREILLENNEADIAELLEDVIDEEGLDKAVILFRILPKDISVDVFSYFAIDTQVDVITAITDKEINYIMQELDFDDMIDVLEELPANIVDKILAKATKEERKQINTFLNYPESSAGSLMTPDYISLRKSWTVKEALEHIREQSLESETIYTCYVMDQGRKLIGIVSLRRLVTARES
ncbi:MAG: magnesium transporter, partial [Firmicutes bacterium]|nr:magnesium transporter [Bacillota bacterium]